jgi:hypothetical protein
LDDREKIGRRDDLKVVVEKMRKQKKMIRGKYKCPNYGDLGHRKNSPKCPLNGTKKRQVQDRPIANNFNSTITIFIILFLCRKRKPRLNCTKGWFPKESSTKSAQGQDGEDNGPSSPPDEDGGPSLPPRM